MRVNIYSFFLEGGVLFGGRGLEGDRGLEVVETITRRCPGMSRSVALQRQPERVTQKLSKNDIYA